MVSKKTYLHCIQLPSTQSYNYNPQGLAYRTPCLHMLVQLYQRHIHVHNTIQIDQLHKLQQLNTCMCKKSQVCKLAKSNNCLNCAKFFKQILVLQHIKLLLWSKCCALIAFLFEKQKQKQRKQEQQQQPKSVFCCNSPSFINVRINKEIVTSKKIAGKEKEA